MGLCNYCTKIVARFIRPKCREKMLSWATPNIVPLGQLNYLFGPRKMSSKDAPLTGAHTKPPCATGMHRTLMFLVLLSTVVDAELPLPLLQSSPVQPSPVRPVIASDGSGLKFLKHSSGIAAHLSGPGSKVTSFPPDYSKGNPTARIGPCRINDTLEICIPK